MGLRVLAGSELRVGVVWMLTPDDSSSDGRKLSYLDKEAESEFDRELHAALRSIARSPGDSRLNLVESVGLLPGATFFSDVVPDGLQHRHVWFAAALRAVSNSDLVFFDPDNGLEVPSRPMGKKNSSKYLYRDELSSTYRVGKSVLVYQHFARSGRVSYARDLAEELVALCPHSVAWTFATPHVLFLLVAQPTHAVTIAERIGVAEAKWPPAFMKVTAHQGEIDLSSAPIFGGPREVSMDDRRAQTPKPSNRFTYHVGDLVMVSPPTEESDLPRTPEKADKR